MNHVLIGTADKTAQLLQITQPGFLLIDDGPIADVFLAEFPRAKLFDPTQHSFNPLRGTDYKRARDFATIAYTASPQGENTLTVRNGKRALARILLDGLRLDRLSFTKSDGDQEAKGIVDELLFSPVLKDVLCRPTNFSFKGSVIARINRAELGDFDAFILANLLTGQTKGQVIVPDFGFYGRPLHMSLIRQNRLTAGVRYLDEVEPKLRMALLTIENKIACDAVAQDAETLAKYTPFIPGSTAHTEFVQRTMGV